MFRFLTSGRDRNSGGERDSSSSNRSVVARRSSDLRSKTRGTDLSEPRTTAVCRSSSLGSRRRPQPAHPAVEAVAASEADEDEVRLRRRRRKVNLSAASTAQQQSKKSAESKVTCDQSVSQSVNPGFIDEIQGKRALNHPEPAQLPDDRPGGANSPCPSENLSSSRPSFVVGR